VSSFVSDIILPPLSVILPMNRNLEEKFAVLRKGPNYRNLGGYNTLKLALEDGAVVMAYGVFVSKLVNFLGVGLALYGLAGVYQWLSNDPIIKHTTRCKYCRKTISEKASTSPR
jgi:large conductance mechanosensitive channel